MTKKEFDLMVDSMIKSGLTKDDIMGILIDTFCEKACDIIDLEVMADWLGYPITDDF